MCRAIHLRLFVFFREENDDYYYEYYSSEYTNFVSILDTTNSSLTLDLTECPDCAFWSRDRGYLRAIGTRDSASRRARGQCFTDYQNYLAVFDCAEGEIPFSYGYSGSGVSL